MSTSHEDVKHDKASGPNKFLHPKSRKCVALMKSMKKESKKVKAKEETRLKQSLIADKLLWFQKQLDPSNKTITYDLVAGLIEKYIARNDEELEQIRIKRSIGSGNRKQLHVGRENAIRLTKEREINDYESCGLEVPNIFDSAQLNLLLKWDGNLKFLPNFKFRRFSKKKVDEKQKAVFKQVTKTDNLLKETSNMDKFTSMEKTEAMES